MTLSAIITSVPEDDDFRRVAVLGFVVFLLLPLILLIAMALDKPRAGSRHQLEVLARKLACVRDWFGQSRLLRHEGAA